MGKRPKYIHGIGVFRGSRGDTAWVKVRLPRGGTFRGKSLAPGQSIEIKVGRLSSYRWDQLLTERDRLQGLADRGEPLEETPTPLFRDYASAWLQRASTRLKSYEIVKIHVEKHLIPAFGVRSLNVITPGLINSWQAGMLETQRPATVKRERDTLAMILNEAVRDDLLDENPCAKANRVRGVVSRQTYLSREQIVILLTAAQKQADWLYDFVLWSLHSGMRKGETLSLLSSDVRQFEDGRVLCLIPKSKSDLARQVYCTPTMIDVLERQKGRVRAEETRVFPIAKMTLRRKWEKARSAAGLSHVTIHDLRRTHSTLAAAAGVDLRTLAGRIGHADLTMLQRTYAALDATAEKDAATRIEAALSTER
tara:strand:- start:14370 stop:15467 length:1098 start_codon:yes stop_codon:yes gene_type:complete